MLYSKLLHSEGVRLFLVVAFVYASGVVLKKHLFMWDIIVICIASCALMFLIYKSSHAAGYKSAQATQQKEKQSQRQIERREEVAFLFQADPNLRSAFFVDIDRKNPFSRDECIYLLKFLPAKDFEPVFYDIFERLEKRELLTSEECSEIFRWRARSFSKSDVETFFEVLWSHSRRNVLQ